MVDCGERVLKLQHSSRYLVDGIMIGANVSPIRTGCNSRGGLFARWGFIFQSAQPVLRGLAFTGVADSCCRRVLHHNVAWRPVGTSYNHIVSDG